MQLNKLFTLHPTAALHPLVTYSIRMDTTSGTVKIAPACLNTQPLLQEFDMFRARGPTDQSSSATLHELHPSEYRQTTNHHLLWPLTNSKHVARQKMILQIQVLVSESMWGED
jgi:hypothetical protein